MPASSTTITATELASRRTELQLIDVRLPEDFATGRIPSAINQCVYEVVFLGELESKGISKERPVCVYGAAGDSHESNVAAEKLLRAGFQDVLDFRGGLAEWRAAGFAIEGSSPGENAPPARDGIHAIDLAESRVVWVGRNLINKHWGHVALKSGHVEFRDGIPSGGEAVLDLHRISCSDLAKSNLHDVLIHHLESDDFFDVARFPEARFHFERAEVCSEKPGCRNLKLHGALTLRGVTKPLVIEASAGFTPDGNAALQSAFTIDRTEWGAIYGSGKFFRKLAGHLVNDEIELQLRIITARSAQV